MEELAKGDIVTIPFPFSDLSNSKLRPALVIAVLSGNDLILSQITSKQAKDKYSIPLHQDEFEIGTLRQESNIRPNKLFTADYSLIKSKIGKLKEFKTKIVVEKICKIIKE